ncbi:MAG: hypothetical protein LBH82_06720 [Bacteroidales bacterium]|jgi:tRNA(Arg) A34 adenosine deaminase TadA|nr:hypothetical protein [Bacteroidales bacterium]
MQRYIFCGLKKEFHKRIYLHKPHYHEVKNQKQKSHARHKPRIAKRSVANSQKCCIFAAMKFIRESDIQAVERILSASGSCGEGIALLLFGEERFTSQNKMLEDDDPTAHAAVVLARRQRKRLRENRDFELLLSCKPCPMCVAALYQAKIKHVYYLENSIVNHIEIHSTNFWYEEIHTCQKK